MFGAYGRFCDGLFSFGSLFGGGYIGMGIGLVLLAVIVYVLFRKGSNSDEGASDSPLDILKTRYVNGEISQEEYLEKMAILTRTR